MHVVRVCGNVPFQVVYKCDTSVDLTEGGDDTPVGYVVPQMDFNPVENVDLTAAYCQTLTTPNAMLCASIVNHVVGLYQNEAMHDAKQSGLPQPQWLFLDSMVMEKVYP